MRTHRRHMQREAGSATLASFLLVTLITGAGLSALTTTSISQNKSQNLLIEKQAFYLAEAGITHGRVLLYQQILANSSLWNTYSTALPTSLIPSTSLAGLGSYTVTVQDASGPALLLTATGTGPNNATVTISSLVVKGYPNTERALKAGKNLTISGNPTFAGLSGGVHANGNLTISGTPVIATTASATGTCTVTGTSLLPPASCLGGQPQTQINRVNITTYYGARDYLLNSNGLVYNKQGTKLTTSPITWNCWTPQPIWSYNKKTGKYYISSYWWKLTCGTTVNGTYYVGANVEVAADVGTALTPWVATIITTKSITITSTSIYVRPPNEFTDGALYKKATENVFLVANQDVLVVGTATQNFTGIMRAGEQVGISGDPWYNGYITANDSANVSSLVSSNYISGNMHLTYDGLMANGLQGTVVVQSMLY